MQFGDFLHNGKAKSAAITGATVDTVKALQHFFPLGFGDTDAVILDLQYSTGILIAAYGDITAFAGIADSIINQIGNQLPNQQGVSPQPGRCDLKTEIDMLGIGAGQPLADNIFYQIGEIKMLH